MTIFSTFPLVTKSAFLLLMFGITWYVTRTTSFVLLVIGNLVIVAKQIVQLSQLLAQSMN